MDRLSEFLVGMQEVLLARFGEPWPVYIVLAIGIVIAVCTLPFIFKKEDAGVRRIKAESVARGSGESAALREDRTQQRLEKFAPYLEPKKVSEFDTVRARLTRAGYYRRDAVRMYFLSRVCVASVVALLTFFFLSATGNVSGRNLLLYSGLMAILGYLFPSYWITRRIQKRQEEISDGFPDALDMLLVCIEAGQSLDQAVVRVSEEISGAHSVLSDELSLVSVEVRAGKDRTTVLREFAGRCDIPDIFSFVTVLIQASQFGTSIAQALRVYASEMRDKRMMKAEEKANLLPTKLALGTMLFTVPPLLLILIGPSLIEIVRAFTGLMSARG